MGLGLAYRLMKSYTVPWLRAANEQPFCLDYLGNLGDCLGSHLFIMNETAAFDEWIMSFRWGGTAVCHTISLPKNSMIGLGVTITPYSVGQ